MTALRPPPEHAHLRWHWIEHCAWAAEDTIWPEFWSGQNWGGAHGHHAITPELATIFFWRYRGPCNAAAIVPDPTEEAQRLVVWGALTGNAEIAESAVVRETQVTAVLTALASMAKEGK